MRRWLAGICVLLCGGCARGTGASTQRAPIRVAAASDLASAFHELGAAFERERGEPVSFTFGSSGLLAKQIEQGAPFDVFAAANVAYASEVVAKGHCDGATQRSFARGRLVIWTRSGGPKPPERLEDLAGERWKRIAIANPEHAPYGQAAMQALQAAGIWGRVQSRLVYGENIQQTLQLAQSGNVEAALVARSLVSPAGGGAWSEVNDTLHAPIEQAIVVCGAGAQRSIARAWVAYVAGPAGRAVLGRYGFALPGQAQAAAP